VNQLVLEEHHLMSPPETASGSRGMSSSKEKTSAQQNPPPGSYPESSPVNAPPSVVSTSVAVKNDLLDIIAEAEFTSCVFKNTPSLVVSKDKWRECEARLAAVSAEGNTTISTTELAELQRELSLLRLKANDFDSQQERFEYASRELEKALELAKAQAATARKEGQAEKEKLESLIIKFKTDLANASAAKKEYEEALRLAKSEARASDVEKLSDDKRRLSVEITNLNNSLQTINSEKSAHEQKVARFEKQVLELTNELNLERSKNAIFNARKGDTFADKAAALPGRSMSVVNAAYTNLSEVARKRLKNVLNNPVEDEKNTIYWFKAALDATRHAVYRPYKRVFGGMHKDMLAMTEASRKKFDPFIIAVRDSLLPTGQPLTEEELNNMLANIPISEIRLNKNYRSKGYNTLQELLDAGHQPTDYSASDIPFKVVEGKAVLRGQKAPSVSPSEEEVDEMDPLAPTTPSDEDDPVSYWLAMRNWFLVKFDQLNKRVRNSLRKRPDRLARYYKLAKGNLFQRVLLVPYNWYIWAFP
jgi:hypothetical protein